MPRTLTDIDLVELSDLAWELLDPGDEHEAQEEAWTALLRPDGSALTTTDELRAHLDGLVERLTPTPPWIPLRAVAALMAFLAEHPERTDLGEALLCDALREELGPEPPADVARWREARRRSPAARLRSHGAPHPRRSDARPRPTDLDLRA